MYLTTTPAGRRLLVATAAVLAALVLAVLVSAVIIRSERPSHQQASPDGSVSRQQPPVPDAAASSMGGGLTAAQSAAVTRDVAALAGMPVVLAHTSTGYPAVPASQRSDADSYAAAFATELLSQNYRLPRAQLLAWVQSEAATSSEPTVVGLVPAALRARLAVYSLTAPSPDGMDPEPVPVPDAADWARWAAVGGYNTAAITRVSEPRSWTDAVRAGRLTDPGVTARTVDAVITTHWRQNGMARTARRDATLVMTLEGPPVRGGFGFVCAVTYHETAVN